MSQEELETGSEQPELNILDMSDDDLLAMDLSRLIGAEPAGQPPAEEQQPEQLPETPQNSDEQDPPEEVPEDEEQDPPAQPVPAEDPAAAEAAREPAGEAGAAQAEAASDAGKEQPDTAPEVNYEEEYKRILAPFKANGKEMQVHSIDEAITLMQMGANYNKKMAGMKPAMKTLKLLENNGLLDEEKLSFLIDLDKKNPEAIKKLVQESGIDPLELGGKSEYKPNTYTVDERELELDAVLEELQDTPTFSKTIDLVSTKWDGPSKQVIAAQPQLLKVLNDHMSRGIYDLISTEVERNRMLGRLNGLSDLEAYKAVGDEIEARGGFAHLVPKKPEAAPQRVPVTPPPKAADPAVRSQKLAASPPKSAAPAAPAADFNPLALSDEEFSKIGNPRLM